MASSTKPQTITYKSVKSLQIPFDVYLPANPKSVPVLLWFHGGGLLQGRRDGPVPHLVRSVKKYNHALISADYRLAPETGVSGICDDVTDCVAFIRNPSGLRKHIGDDVVDVNRLAVAGGSAGGYLAFLAGLYCEPKPNVILPVYPITDPLGYFFTTAQPRPLFQPAGEVDKSTVVSREQVAPFLDPNGEVVANNDPKSQRSMMYYYMLQEANLAELWGLNTATGAYEDAANDRWRIAKALPKRRLPPTYVVHGDVDRAVGVEQSDEVVGAMLGEGLEVRYERLRGRDHVFDRDEKVDLAAMYDFMHSHLRVNKL